MFRFNFNINDSVGSLKGEPEGTNEETSETFKESKKVQMAPDQYTKISEYVKNIKVNCFISNPVEIGFLDQASLGPGSWKSSTDLVPRLYEGGFKIWECTQDLADLLTKSEENHFEGLKVCDLGLLAY